MSAGVRERLFELAESGTRSLRGNEVLLLHYVGEESEFVRWNHARVRQAMTVRQEHLTVSLIDGSRKDTLTLALSGDSPADRTLLAHGIGSLREGLPALPEDPYLLYSTEPGASDHVAAGRLPSAREAVEAISAAAAGTDMVGFHASGPIRRGFASSLGHRYFHEVPSFQFDFSLYHEKDKAVQSAYSTSSFDEMELRGKIERSRSTLEHLAKPEKTIHPGVYRAYLEPAALNEIVTMLNWGGVSKKAQATKSSCLQKLADGEAHFSEKLSLSENTEEGLAPSFDDVGFRKPARVPLIVAGRFGGALVGPRTAREYGSIANADAEESLRSADVAGGSLSRDGVLAALDTGIYVGNLWYLNFSDRLNARITGMTRFATFWVEDGRIVAPLRAMRFDDTLYRLLGDHLVDFTREREFLPSSSTYGQRSVESARLPGALVANVTFTL
jgi:predicted Zn-dependent protease